MPKLTPASDEKIAYQGRMIEIVNQDMTDGKKTITFELARRAPGIRLILVNKDKKTVTLSKEHRYELGGFDYRLPGGKVFDSLDEYNQFLDAKSDILIPAKAKALAEAEEEVGLRLNSVQHYHTSFCGATIQWDLIYFVCNDWEEVDQKLEAGEVISRSTVPIEEAKELALNGGMSEERSALVLLRYLSSLA